MIRLAWWCRLSVPPFSDTRSSRYPEVGSRIPLGLVVAEGVVGHDVGCGIPWERLEGVFFVHCAKGAYKVHRVT